MSPFDLSSAPYVGPRSFTAREPLYGREREARELRALLISERIVLLYSPSGAGKSSLLNARVIPELEARQFAVQPVLRVSLGAPGAGGNRYLDSLALSLQPQTPGAATPAGLPAGASLATFLDARPGASSPGGEVFIFDQFEEILTLDPTDVAAKEQFFREVGAALRRPTRWALFAMREEYVAALDPYLRYLPTRLSCTFRLDLLGIDGAAEAIARPAREQRGVEVAPEVVRGLVHNLSLVQVQRADGSSSQEPGLYVEPVQLQVVCLRMWDEWLRRRAPDSVTIGPGDVDAVDNVGDALRDYYERRVAEVAAQAAPGAPAGERAIREWFDDHLITPGGIRGQVLMGEGSTAGLANTAIVRLVDAYLVRSERRGGRTWYELAHDRLIDPVRTSNAEWRRANLVPAQVRATLWDEQGRPEGLLLRGAELRAANAWSRTADIYVTALEQEYLAACRRLARARAVTRALVAAVAVLALLASFAAVRALVARNEATARQLAAQSAQSLEVNPPRALLLAAEAADGTRPLAPLPEAVGSLYAALAATGGAPLVAADTRLVAVDTAGPLVAAAGEDGVVYLWRDTAPGAPATPLAAHDAALNDVAFSPDGRLLASAGDDVLVVWELGATTPVPRRLDAHGTGVVAVAFSPDGRALASADDGGGVLLWNPLDLDAPPARLAGLDGQVTQLAFSPDGARIAAGDDGGALAHWERATPGAAAARFDHDAPLTALAFRADGRALLAGHADGLVRLVDLGSEAQTEVARLGANARAVAFSPDGSLVVAGDGDGQIAAWSAGALTATGGEPVAPLVSLRDHRGAIDALGFSPDGATLLSTSADGTLRLRPAANLDADPIVLRGHEGAIFDAHLGAAVVTAGADGTVRAWDPARLSAIPWLRDHAAPLGALQFSPDGSQLLSADLGGIAVSRSVSEPYVPAEPLHPPIGGAALLAYSRDGRYLAAVSDLTLRLWDLQAGDEPRLLRDSGDEITTLTISPDGASLAAGTTGGAVLIFATGDPAAPPRALPPQEELVRALAFSPDGARLAVGSSSGAVQVWPFPALAGAPPPVAAHTSGVTALAFSPDGRTLASGDDTGMIRLGDGAGRGAPRATLNGHTGPITALAISANGRSLASTSLDGTARLWDLDRPGEAPTLLAGHGFGLAAAAFSPDGRTLATGDNAGRVRLWPTDAAVLRDLACATAGRNLRPAEWTQSFGGAAYKRTCAALPGIPEVRASADGADGADSQGLSKVVAIGPHPPGPPCPLRRRGGKFTAPAPPLLWAKPTGEGVGG